MSLNADHSFNPAERLRDKAKLTPEKPAIISEAGQLSYRELESLSDEFAQKLKAAGLRQGMKTILMVKPGPSLYITAFALLKLGAIPVIVDPGMGIQRLLYSYRSVGAEAFVGITIAHIIRLLTPQYFPNLKVKAWVKGNSLQAKALAPLEAGVFPIAQVKPQDLSIITFTTGSTGPAKPVEIHFGMLSGIVDTIEKDFKITPSDCDLVTVPFFGMVALCLGATIVLPPMNPGKPADIDPKVISEWIMRHKVTTMFASPALLDRLGAFAVREKIIFPSLKCVNSGGAPATLAIISNFRKAIPEEGQFFCGWGATEGLPLAAIEANEILNQLQPQIEKGSGSPLGRLASQVELLFLKQDLGPVKALQDDMLCSKGQIGELVVSAPHVSISYHELPAENEKYKIKDPKSGKIWHRTGDLGWMDEDSRIFFAGRKAHSFTNKDGLMMHSVACEGITNAHPKVKRSALVPVRGEPVLCLELFSPASDQEEKNLLRDVLQITAKHPMTQSIRTILIHPKFPVDLRHNAKIDRPLLSQWAELKLNPRPHFVHLAKIVPIFGWFVVFLGAYLPEGAFWTFFWWVTFLLSTLGHIVQIPRAMKIGQMHGYTSKEVAFWTIFLGATWWKTLAPLDSKGDRS